MKSIYEILSAVGLEMPEDKKAGFEKELYASYKTVNELEKKESRITALEAQLQTAKDGLKAFEGVDVNDLKNQIATLTGTLQTKESEYQAKLADMEFDTLIASAVQGAKGRNHKAIAALLDLDALKASKNQTEDIKAAIDALKTENEYLFETESAPPPYAPGAGSQVQNTKYSPEVNAIRAAAGLKTE